MERKKGKKEKRRRKDRLVKAAFDESSEGTD
jgi:hypothetical protein